MATQDRRKMTDDERYRARRAAARRRRQRQVRRQRMILAMALALAVVLLLLIVNVRRGASKPAATPEVTAPQETQVTDTQTTDTQGAQQGQDGQTTDAQDNLTTETTQTPEGTESQETTQTPETTETQQTMETPSSQGPSGDDVLRGARVMASSMVGSRLVSLDVNQVSEEIAQAEEKESSSMLGMTQAFLEIKKKVLPPEYVWASPKGATGGTLDDPITEEDPSLKEGTTKVMYLTFDDGPGPYTERLLEILDAHNAKATFFVTGHFTDNQGLIKEEAARGHSVAVHTFTHEYNEIYASLDAYWADFERIQAVIEQQTGHRTELMRFPGGSSNAVSRKYCEGIMTALVSDVEAKGYTYFDWNVDSHDGESVTDSDSVFNHIVAESEGLDTCVVLCHDTKETTVDAIDRVLTWGEENGYTFLPLSPHSQAPHHGVNN